jgi:hypothetical protein
MRASLPHTLRERGRSRAEQHKRPEPAGIEPDLTVERVRSAGGPIDEASYACQCGYLFLAPVSTTVICPHCRAPQAW